MKRALFIYLFIAALFFSFSAKAQWILPEDKADYVLVISSYNYENEWGTSTAKSIQQEIEKQNSNLIVNIVHAGISDRKSFLAGRFGVQAAFSNGMLLQHNKINRALPKMLILIGDEIWMYYRIMDLRGIWEKIPVILVGVKPQIMEDYSGFFTGMTVEGAKMIPLINSFKELPVAAIQEKENESYTIWLMRQLIPDLREIVYLSNGDYQDQYSLLKIRETLEIQYPELSLTVIDNNKIHLDSIQKKLSTLPDDAAILLHSANTPRGVSAPVFTLTDRTLAGKSVIGGYYPSVREYGLQTTDIAMRIYKGEFTDSMPMNTIRGEVPHLNREALDHFGITHNSLEIPDTVYYNIPPPFYVQHMRTLLILALVFIIIVIVFILNIRDKRYRKTIVNSANRYKSIYDEYQIVYENMPMGLLLLDLDGNIINRNSGSNDFLELLPSDEKDEFNLFQSDIIDDASKQKIKRKQYINKIFEYKGYYLRFIIRTIQNEESNSENILMIVIDNTDIQKEREAKERIYEIFNFAMDASSLGVAEYNLVDKSGFATDAWYKNLYIPKSNDFSDIHRNVVEEDRNKIDNFLTQIDKNRQKRFWDTICVNDVTSRHWIYYVTQLIEYAPEKGRIIVAEVVLNVDKQKHREEELAIALHEAQESDRLKNAFIANMSSDIRPALEELVTYSTQLTECVDEGKKQELMSRIEANNDILLQFIERIIDLSRNGTE